MDPLDFKLLEESFRDEDIDAEAFSTFEKLLHEAKRMIASKRRRKPVWKNDVS